MCVNKRIVQRKAPEERHVVYEFKNKRVLLKSFFPRRED